MSTDAPHDTPPAPRSMSLIKKLLIVAGTLVVIAIGLAAVSAPAIMASREAARRSMCLSNLKLIGMALASYHDSYRLTMHFAADGFVAYPDTASGPVVKGYTIMRSYRNANMPYTMSEMVGSDRRCRFGTLDQTSICTGDVERNNLTIRTFMKRLTRLSLGFSKKIENLAAATALHMAHYNFCRRHGNLRVTLAIAARVTDRLWSLGDLLERSAA